MCSFKGMEVKISKLFGLHTMYKLQIFRSDGWQNEFHLDTLKILNVKLNIKNLTHDMLKVC